MDEVIILVDPGDGRDNQRDNRLIAEAIRRTRPVVRFVAEEVLPLAVPCFRAMR